LESFERAIDVLREESAEVVRGKAKCLQEISGTDEALKYLTSAGGELLDLRRVQQIKSEIKS